MLVTYKNIKTYLRLLQGPSMQLIDVETPEYFIQDMKILRRPISMDRQTIVVYVVTKNIVSYYEKTSIYRNIKHRLLFLNLINRFNIDLSVTYSKDEFYKDR